MVLEGDLSKIHKALGWRAEIRFERTLTDFLGWDARRGCFLGVGLVGLTVPSFPPVL